MLLSDLITECDDDIDKLSSVLKLLDATVKYIHSKGYFIIDFDPKKIILVAKNPNLANFGKIIAPVDYDPRGDININIYQMAKIGLFSFNHIQADGNMNQAHFNFIVENLKNFNQNGNIPSEIYEYYEDLFINGNINYLNDYLDNRKKEEAGRQSGVRKSLVTEAGRALSSTGIQLNSDNNNAYVNILFIPSILTLLYLIGLFIYVFILN